MKFGSAEIFGPGALALGEGAGDFRELRSGGWNLEVGEAVESGLRVMDTFDWGVWHGGHVLVWTAGRLEWCLEAGGAVVEVEPCAEWSGGEDAFWWDLEDGVLREAVAGYAGVRRLGRVAAFGVRRVPWTVRDTEGKAVFRFWEVRLSAGGESGSLGFLRPAPLRGYAAEAENFLRACRARGLVGEVRTGLLREAFMLAGVEPRGRVRFGEPSLEPGRPAAEALREVMVPAITLAWENVPGIIRDTDTEFLHDYRVCLRRVRSALSVLPEVFGEQSAAGLKAGLGGLARETNRLRDLDVFLLAGRDYEGSLPEELLPSLRALAGAFKAERSAEQSRVAGVLGSETAMVERDRIAALVKDPAGLPPGASGNEPIGPLAGRFLARRFRKISRLVGAMGAGTPDSGLHGLRIQCKKLRYLLDFFYPLFPEAGALLERPLRRLQNRLGAFNDVSVQMAFLLDHWFSREADPEIALGLGAMVGVLNERRTRLRAEAVGALGLFQEPDMAEAVRRASRARFVKIK